MSEQFQHYSHSRYVICNLHSFFQHGHYEIRAYNGYLHAGEVRAQIVLARAISNVTMTKKYCSPQVSQSDNMREQFAKDYVDCEEKEYFRIMDEFDNN